MGHEYSGLSLEFGRPHDPWEKFTHRNERIHRAEDTSRLCIQNATSHDVINECLAHDNRRLYDPIPHKSQLLRDFLSEVLENKPVSSQPYEFDIERRCQSSYIVLVDDRQNHPDCEKKIRRRCTACQIFSRYLTVPQLRDHLIKERTVLRAEKRIIFLPDLTPDGALVLVATAAKRSSTPIRLFLQRYLAREHVFTTSTSWGFFLEFHLPYHAMRRNPSIVIQDARTVRGKPLRRSEEVPLRDISDDHEDLYYHEAQTSSLSWGTDEWFWTELFLVETYFGSEPLLRTYLNPPTDGIEGDGNDPPLGGSGSMQYDSCFDPREYFLHKLDRRLDQVAKEYSALVETFNQRMENYLSSIRGVFRDDADLQHTKTISNVIETVQIFVDCIGGTVEFWDNLYKTQISLFTTHARDKPLWPALLDRIVRNVLELRRLRRLLETKRDRFKFKLESLHTVSSLDQADKAIGQTDAAIQQGKDISTLTKMTVYIAFPVLVTTAIFSMDIVTPEQPWAVLGGVLVIAFFLNVLIANLVEQPWAQPRELWRRARLWTL
ncbi:hypothetical protein OPT61_g3298 [Boeremia exigua]|uniref:Uncharacterized protein n=1 Tax=Boeremia exigua TaxID=749465 RepID=A0ACC2IIE2_9PLEO|nr:hypothetical protein OPT61_g3298 [Boeremia exigua]